MATDRDAKELVLALGDYAYLQDLTTGTIRLYTGPAVINQSAQEAPVKYTPKVGFERVAELKDALCKSVIAVEGYYLVLFNPVKNEEGKSAVSLQPPPSISAKPSPVLDVGKRINIPGPVQFPLWPGQSAHYVRGHHLRTNEYLKIQVYNADEAKANWSTAILQKTMVQPTPVNTDGMTEAEKEAALAKAKEAAKETMVITRQSPPDDLTVGKTYIVKGTEVSFYIPPTGIKVLSERDEAMSNARGADSYVREALTLERLENCVLVDETGTKRYEIGPQVVFPKPTEEFVTDDAGNKKFRALELNEIQGIHVKAIANIDEEIADSDGKGNTVTIKPREGAELFITGRQTAIFYPRADLSLIRYDGKAKHFATAIPEGEGRYLLERKTGVINIVKGPNMCLPDPRTHVFVHRALSDHDVRLWYPGNEDARQWNAELRKLQSNTPTTRASMVSDGELERGAPTRTRNRTSGAIPAGTIATAIAGRALDPAATRMLSSNAMMDASVLGEGTGGPALVDEFTRKSSYTQPRAIHLDTKFQGVPTIDVWEGYAVLVKSKTGRRQVIVGPQAHLMGYDETLATLELSTGKPKNTDHLHETAYLNVKNNKVTDLVSLETADHVVVEAKLIYRVDFLDSHKEKWFSVSNYVKYLCDHIRSILKGAVQKMKIADFYGHHTEVIRNVILGKPNEAGDVPGMLFDENGMKVLDVDVLKAEISDQRIKGLLDGYQHSVVQANIQLEGKKHEREVTEQQEALARAIADARAETAKHTTDLEVQKLTNDLLILMKRIGNQVAEAKEKREVEIQVQETRDLSHHKDLVRQKAEAEQLNEIRKAEQKLELDALTAQAEAIVKKYNAIAPGFQAVLASISEHAVAERIAQALSVQTMIGGESFTDTWNQIFKDTPFTGMMGKLLKNAPAMLPEGNGNGLRS